MIEILQCEVVVGSSLWKYEDEGKGEEYREFECMDGCLLQEAVGKIKVTNDQDMG